MERSNPIRVCGAQLVVTNDIETNLASIRRAILVASSAGANILLTPEGSLSGYTHQFDQSAVQNALDQVTGWAREANLGLALGTCFIAPEDGRCYNQVRFYTQAGEFLGFHTKTLTCGTLTQPPEGEINHFAVRPLRIFDFQGIHIGGLICNDLWANPACTPMPDPHLTHQLAQRGARIIFHAVNGGRDGSEWSEVAWRYHESNLRMRAAASQIWIVTVDSSFPPNLRCSAPSGVVSPEGSWVCQADTFGEQFFVYPIDLEK
ncbi:MAG: carbon-nitrogen hydrolase family protein [Chloroflexi bacterium]|nr:MAG: carbon-nitrogen hydrolase family protein [Chloroflexota bacterium]